MEYEKPLIVKHSEKDITNYVLKFIEDIKPRLKGIEIKLPGDFPHNSQDSDEYSYCIYIHYLTTHNNKEKHNSTGMFPIYYNIKNSLVLILDHNKNFEEDLNVNLFTALKKAEEYVLSCNSKTL